MATAKLQLASDLLLDEFGPLTQRVCAVLLERGDQTLDELTKAAGLERDLVRTTLLVALQHNFIYTTEQVQPVAPTTSSVGSTGGPAAASVSTSSKTQSASALASTLVRYHVLIDNILIRVRFPRFILSAHDKWGVAGELVLDRLLREGRARCRHLIDTIIQEHTDSSWDRRSHLLQTFGLLREQRFIIPCPQPGTAQATTNAPPSTNSSTVKPAHTSDPVSVAPSRSGKRKMEKSATLDDDVGGAESQQPTKSNKKSKPSKSTAKSKTAATETDANATSSKSSNNRAVVHSVAPELSLYESEQDQHMYHSEDNDQEAIKNYSSVMDTDPSVYNNTIAPGGFQASGLDLQITTANAQLEQDSTVWCVDYDRFNHESRKEACIAFVAEKVDPLAATIVRAMFDMSEASHVISEERLFNALSSPDATEQDSSYNNNLHNAPNTSISSQTLTSAASGPLGNLNNGSLPAHSSIPSEIRALPRARLRGYLDLMAKDRAALLIKMAQPPGYVINQTSIVETLKQKVIESVIVDKFGADSLRIFRLLTMKKLLEQKQISELAMIPVKETRDCLYKMLAESFVHLQEVPRTSEHTPNKTFYLWSVRWTQVTHLLTDDIYRIMRKVKLRLRHTLEHYRDLVNKRDEEERILASGSGFLTPLERASLDELATIQERLELSILHLDDTLMTLVDL